MSTRAERITPSIGQEVLYSDLTVNMKVHPNTGALVKVNNARSVSQALRLLILTNAGEALYDPLRGGNLRAILFEPISEFTANDIKDEIRTTIFNNDDRVDRLRVDVTPSYTDDRYQVVVEFGLRNQAETERFSLVLVRTR